MCSMLCLDCVLSVLAVISRSVCASLLFIFLLFSVRFNVVWEFRTFNPFSVLCVWSWFVCEWLKFRIFSINQTANACLFLFYTQNECILLCLVCEFVGRFGNLRTYGPTDTHTQIPNLIFSLFFSLLSFDVIKLSLGDCQFKRMVIVKYVNVIIGRSQAFGTC